MSCGICGNRFIQNVPISVIKCGHIFHTACIESPIPGTSARRRYCPTCRAIANPRGFWTARWPDPSPAVAAPVVPTPQEAAEIADLKERIKKVEEELARKKALQQAEIDNLMDFKVVVDGLLK